MSRIWMTAVALWVVLVASGCGETQERAWVLPDPAKAEAWFGEGTEVRMSGNVLEITGTIDPAYLRRGGRLWSRSAPYYYLFNVHVRDLLREYPDIAAVRAIVHTREGRELARATLHRAELSEVQWKEALARASLAQTQGTEKPRKVEELIHYGEDHTEYRYAR